MWGANVLPSFVHLPHRPRMHPGVLRNSCCAKKIVKIVKKKKKSVCSRGGTNLELWGANVLPASAPHAPGGTGELLSRGELVAVRKL